MSFTKVCCGAFVVSGAHRIITKTVTETVTWESPLLPAYANLLCPLMNEQPAEAACERKTAYASKQRRGDSAETNPQERRGPHANCSAVRNKDTSPHSKGVLLFLLSSWHPPRLRNEVDLYGATVTLSLSQGKPPLSDLDFNSKPPNTEPDVLQGISQQDHAKWGHFPRHLSTAVWVHEQLC